MNKKLLVVSALWCPSCLLLNKHLKRLNDSYNIQIKKLDYDFDGDEVEKYNVGEILPVMILQDENSNELSRLVGEHSYDEIISFIEGEK